MSCAVAITRVLLLSGSLALAPWVAGAQGVPQVAAARAAALAGQPVDEADGAVGVPPMPMGAMSMPMPSSRNVRKLSDSDLSCAQMYAETQQLEKTSQAREAEAAEAQAAMAQTQSDMMKQAGGMGGGGMGSMLGGSLLSLIPGGGQIQGYAMQAAADARRASMQESVEKMMQVQTRLVNAEQARELAQARSEHLADLFLKKGCRLSEVKAAGAGAAP
jgi:hypothetical protein